MVLLNSSRSGALIDRMATVISVAIWLNPHGSPRDPPAKGNRIGSISRKTYPINYVLKFAVSLHVDALIPTPELTPAGTHKLMEGEVEADGALCV